MTTGEAGTARVTLPRPLRRGTLGTASLVAVAVLLAMAQLLLTPLPAQAHETVELSSPSAGARLESGPATVSVTLTGPLDPDAPVSLSVADARGRAVPTGDPVLSGDLRTVTVSVAGGTSEGAFLVEFAGVTADTHPVRAAFAFTVGDAVPISASGSATDAAGAHPVTAALNDIATLLGYLGLALAGALVLLRLGGASPGRSASRTVLSGCLLMAASALAALLLHGPLVAGAGPAAALQGDLLGATVASSHGRLLLLRCAAALVLAAVALPMLRARSAPAPAPTRENVAMVTGLTVLVSFAGTGHPSTDDLSFLTLTAGMVHSGAMAAWLGGLLLTAVRATAGAGHPPVTVQQLRVLAELATVAVVLVLSSGLYLAWRTVGTPAAMLTTGYGAVLAVKLALVLGLLSVAARGRQALRDHDAEPGASPTAVLQRVRTGVLLEVALAVAVLVTVAQLVSTTPPTVP